MTAVPSPSAPAPTVEPEPGPPSLARLVEQIHRSCVDHPAARLIHVRLDAGEASTELGFWNVPPLAGHPIEPLVGFVAPARWDAVGLVTTGRLRRLDTPDRTPEPIVTTVLFGRDGAAASTIGASDEPPSTMDDPPEGLVPDVLRRVLGRPTPPPDQPTGALVELTWLDRVIAGSLHPRGRRRTWAWLADRHPLRGGGPTPEPEELAARTAAYSRERTWSGLRLLAVTDDLPAVRYGPPGGTTAPASTWFDDGSLSRWMLGRLPPAEALLPDLAAVLPSGAADALIEALSQIDVARATSGTA